MDEIGTEEKLPLPEWEWDFTSSTSSSGGSGSGPARGSLGADSHPHFADVGGGGARSVGGEGSGRSSMDLAQGSVGGHVPSAKYVHARVSAEGRTRVLLISSHKDIRRTISTFGVREAALVRQKWRGQLVADKYRG